MKNATSKSATPGSLRAVKTINRENLSELSLAEIEMLFDAYQAKSDLLSVIERKLSEYNEKHQYREHFVIGDLRWFDGMFNVYAEAKEFFCMAGAYHWSNDLNEMFHILLFGDADILEHIGNTDDNEPEELRIKGRSIKEMHWTINFINKMIGEVESEVDRVDHFLNACKLTGAA